MPPLPPAPVGVVDPLLVPEASFLLSALLLLDDDDFLAFSWLAASPLLAGAEEELLLLFAVALLLLLVLDDEEPAQLFIMGEEVLVPDATGPLLLFPLPTSDPGDAVDGEESLAGGGPGALVVEVLVVVVGVCEAVVVDAGFSSSMAHMRQCTFTLRFDCSSSVGLFVRVFNARGAQLG